MCLAFEGPLTTAQATHTMLRRFSRAGGTRTSILRTTRARATSVDAVPLRTRCIAAALAATFDNRPALAPAAASRVHGLEPAMRGEFGVPLVQLDPRDALLAARSAHAHAAAFEAAKPLFALAPLCKVDRPCHARTPMPGTSYPPTHASLKALIETSTVHCTLGEIMIVDVVRVDGQGRVG